MNLRHLIPHLLLRVLLQEEVLLELIELSPEVSFIARYVVSIVLKTGDLFELLLFVCLHLRDLLVKCVKLFHERLSLFNLLWSFFPCNLASLQLQILLQLMQLLPVDNSFVFFLFDFLVQLFEYFVEACEADRILDLQATLFRDIALN